MRKTVYPKYEKIKLQIRHLEKKLRSANIDGKQLIACEELLRQKVQELKHTQDHILH